MEAGEMLRWAKIIGLLILATLALAALQLFLDR